MKYVNLLLSHPAGTTLDSFAIVFFATIAADDFHERQSSHYLEGRYFTGRVGPITYTVMRSDHSDLPFWVQLETTALNEAEMSETVDETVRGRLLPSGFRVARIVSFAGNDEKWVDYE